MTKIFTILQLSAVAVVWTSPFCLFLFLNLQYTLLKIQGMPQVCLQPTNGVLENTLADPTQKRICCSKCNPEGILKVIVCHHSNYNNSNASIFWRYQFIDWSFWFHPSRLYLACCVLQAIEEEHYFLVKCYYCNGLLSNRDYSSSCSSQTNSSWCQNI